MGAQFTKACRSGRGGVTASRCSLLQRLGGGEIGVDEPGDAGARPRRPARGRGARAPARDGGRLDRVDRHRLLLPELSVASTKPMNRKASPIRGARTSWWGGRIAGGFYATSGALASRSRSRAG